MVVPPFGDCAISVPLSRDLRSNHAGETGAVYIYQGMLKCATDTEVRAFAQAHLATERAHLELLEAWLPCALRSALLPLWRLSGWTLGALAALMGKEAAFATVEAVEEFVVAHYQAQIEQTSGGLKTLLQLLQDDEAEHLQDAARRRDDRPRWLNAWAWMVRAGSAGAVRLARLV